MGCHDWWRGRARSRIGRQAWARNDLAPVALINLPAPHLTCLPFTTHAVCHTDQS